VENLDLNHIVFDGVFRNRTVLVTGHTGFKGSWLATWLLRLGANVIGYSLPPGPGSLFERLDLASKMTQFTGDVRELDRLINCVATIRPDFIFHLAAQPLVRYSYAAPVETFSVNVLGTVNVLEAVRTTLRPCSVVVVTTDKCYENREWAHSYREPDPLGGYDPYSSSKAAAELVVSAYRNSYFAESSVRVATARAGNVIGGGDWAPDRIIPDCVRALRRNHVIAVRNRLATRPWQHVLEPLSGYLWLAALLNRSVGSDLSDKYTGAFNFGPNLEANRTVGELVCEVVKHWHGRWEDFTDPNAVHEAGRLNLSVDKAFHLLNWRPVWTFSQAVHKTMSWYQADNSGRENMQDVTAVQISEYEADAQASEVKWAVKSI
jgi:CDP-glucose 4,6-dehydratase